LAGKSFNLDKLGGLAIHCQGQTPLPLFRGNNPLFYLDFKDLGTLILNNWESFKTYFPNQAWISAKIEELAHCRNLVAHNSYLGKHERDVIRVNFDSIVKQIGSASS
jgi:hypothetical protein